MRTIKTELCDEFYWASSSDMLSSEMHVSGTVEIMRGLKTKVHFCSNVNGDLQGKA